jgi:hypothetical protein
MLIGTVKHQETSHQEGSSVYSWKRSAAINAIFPLTAPGVARRLVTGVLQDTHLETQPFGNTVVGNYK